MNYRHIYHAGNFADVLKHWVLTLILEKLRQKETPFCLLDTHAGLGMYDLQHPNAQNTMEHQNGVAQLLVKPLAPEFAAYMRIVQAYTKDHAIYPGSAAIMQEFLRPTDRLLLNELHPEDFAQLKENFAQDRRIKIYNNDAYQCLKALLPPPERRGLVLIDPAFEVKDEFTRIIQGLQDALKRFANGIYVIWYPIKDRAVVEKFYRDVRKINLPPALCVEFYANEDIGVQLNSCGLLILNPPWQLDETLRSCLPKLLGYLNFTRGLYNLTDWN